LPKEAIISLKPEEIKSKLEIEIQKMQMSDTIVDELENLHNEV
jgi:hypothetical protein